MSRVARRDISRLQPAVTLSDGRVRAEAHLTRCGIFTYAQPDGTTRRELRPAEEVFRPDSLNSFAQVPVTDDHPPVMLTAKNARKYAVGTVGESIIRDEDHVRGKIGVFDADVIAKMRAGKLDVSCGYTCDLEEKPGVDPVYGKYDAIQRNIVGNHLAIVDRGRAGSAKVRMDGMTVLVDSSGTQLASRKNRAKLLITDMADASVAEPLDIDSEQPSCDPDDLATRSKKKGTGTTGVKAAEAVNDSAESDPDDDLEDEGEEGDEEDDTVDPYESSAMDADDVIPAPDAPEAPPAPPAQDDADRIAAHTYAVPSKKKIPIHSPDATKAAMDNFGSHKFAGPDEKHAAFNRVYQKAIQFGIPRDQRHAFQDTHGSKLDRADHKDKMIELKKAQDALAAAVKRADAAEQKLAKAEGQIVTLKQDAADKEKARKDADDGIQARMDAKIDLLVRARATGAAVDTSMTPRQIHCAVVKHVRKLDIADDKHDAYAEALFDGAMEHAKTDALETLVGGAALASVRKTVEEIRTDASDKTDAAPNESEAARRLNERTTTQWMQPARKEIK